jgi:thiol-disulfide isomerase/thioredoxin
MIFNVVGAFSYYVYVKLNGYVKWVTLLLLLIAPLFMAVKGYALWFNKLDNGTFEGETFFKMEALYTVVEESGKLVGASDLHGKLVLMDFWFSGCKPCFEEFPELQKIHNKYKGNKKVNIYSVNLPVRSDSVNQAFNTLRKEGYDFPMLILKTDGKPNVFDIKSCPTAVVLNVEGDIIFKGNLLKAEKYMDKLLK